MKDQLSRTDFLIAIQRADADGFPSLALALTLLFRRVWPREDTP